MKNIKIIYLMIIMILISLSGCEDNNDTVFDHNASVEGYVTFEDATTDTLFANVTILRNNTSLGNTITDTLGYYFFDELATGEYFISIDKEGYARSSSIIELFSNQTVRVDTVMLMAMSTMEYFTPVIDGEIDVGWEPVYTQDHVSDWGPNDFESLYMAYDENYLYINVSGEFEEHDQNSVTILLDIDNNGFTGINDLTIISGGNPGNRIKKNIFAPEEFGADFAFNSGFRLSDEAGVFSLLNPSQIDQGELEGVSIVMNTNTIEFAVPLAALYGNMSNSNSISLVAFIGGGGVINFANDVIPQGAGDFEGTFYEVFTIGF